MAAVASSSIAGTKHARDRPAPQSPKAIDQPYWPSGFVPHQTGVWDHLADTQYRPVNTLDEDMDEKVDDLPTEAEPFPYLQPSAGTHFAPHNTPYVYSHGLPAKGDQVFWAIVEPIHHGVSPLDTNNPLSTAVGLYQTLLWYDIYVYECQDGVVDVTGWCPGIRERFVHDMDTGQDAYDRVSKQMLTWGLAREVPLPDIDTMAIPQRRTRVVSADPPGGVSAEHWQDLWGELQAMMAVHLARLRNVRAVNTDVSVYKSQMKADIDRVNMAVEAHKQELRETVRADQTTRALMALQKLCLDAPDKEITGNHTTLSAQ